MCLEVVWGLQTLLQLDMVVDLPVDCEDDLAVVANERLGTSVCMNYQGQFLR